MIPLLAAVALTALSPSDGSFDVSAPSAVIMEAQTGKVLWSKGASTPRFPASTTKIMTALLLLEHCRSEELIKADASCESVDGASLHLKAGETITAANMLRAILLRSANDACEMVAKHISGSVPSFAKLMNERAKAIGCTATTFENPHGLNCQSHLTTAHDLALIAREAMKDPDFRSVVKNRKVAIDRSLNKEDLLMVSKNKFLLADKTADGIKTGYTKDAGHCFVGSATRNGYRVITVVLKSADWLADTESMVNWAFENHIRQVVAKAGALSYEAPVAHGYPESVRCAVKDNVIDVSRKSGTQSPIVDELLDDGLEAPLKKGDRVGYVSYTDRDGYTQRIPLVATADVERRATVQGIVGTPTLIVAGLAGWGAVRVSKRSKRRTLKVVRSRR